MNEIAPWTDSSWYALGSLLTQLGFLIAAIWFARGLLKTLLRFQEQLGALLKLTITPDPTERQSSGVGAKQPLTESRSYWLMPSVLQPPNLSEPAEVGAGRLVTAWHGVVLWLNAPMTTSEVAPWRRFIHWLQAPAGS